MSQQPRRGRRLVLKSLLIILSALFGIAIAEIVLRFANYSYPLFYSHDPSRGYALLPKAEGWYTNEGKSYVRINSDGLRDREHLLAKPSNTVRIAVLGDSFAEALQVGQAEAFWGVMQEKLKECNAFDRRDVEVINFGVSGYGTAQELITLKEQVWKYSPDIVMLAVTTSNDVTDNSRALKKTNEIPYFVYQHGQLTRDDSFKNSRSFRWSRSSINRMGRWFRVNSRFVQAAIEAHRGFKLATAWWRPGASQDALAKNKDPQTSQNTDLFSRADELGIDNLVYLEPTNAVWNDAWHVTEGLIIAISDEVKSRQAKFFLVTLSNAPQVLPTAEARRDFMKRFGIGDLFYPDNRLKALGEQTNFPVVTLAPELQKFAKNNHAFLHGSGPSLGNGHWNQLGHRVAGELLAKKICEGGPFQIAPAP